MHDHSIGVCVCACVSVCVCPAMIVFKLLFVTFLGHALYINRFSIAKAFASSTVEPCYDQSSPWTFLVENEHATRRRSIVSLPDDLPLYNRKHIKYKVFIQNA